MVAGIKGTDESLQDFLGLDDDDQLIDVKMSIDDYKTPPSEFLGQLAKIVEADKNNLLTDFIDY